MDELLKHLGNIYAMDRATLAVICVLCIGSSYVVREYLAQPIMVIFAFPVLFGLSVIVQYLFMLGEVYVPNRMDQWLMWTVIASICGNLVGIAAVAIAGRLNDRTVPVQRSATRPNRVGTPQIRL